MQELEQPQNEIGGVASLHRIIDSPPHKTTHEEYKDTAEAMLVYLRNIGGEYFDNVGELYERLRGEDICVRREDPRSVIEFLEEKEPLIFKQEEKDPYPNAAKWKYEEGSRGLENAFLEGRTDLNGVVTVIGFEADKLNKLPLTSELDHVVLPGGKIIDRSNVVSLEGEIKKENLRFIVARFPANYVSEKKLTEEEIERLSLARGVEGPKYIFRGVLFGKKNETIH